ncbi:MAG: DUF2185 domain-containing protein [Bacteroidales bacterium]|jgi:hypothetical protein|nr:DUF2185 domain-containing protein [Bacteroidales bacterium]MBO7625626.1 DUF2185 domain-containing protein [Bacteroidales bacterium]MBR5664169.1 DUF2185 domain-containing protein [Bacteroidales bacterium]
MLLFDLNMAVITTRYVLDNNSPILYVFHYEDDGVWTFIGDEKCQNSDYRVVSVEEIINIDSSILELADMPCGYCAKRTDKNISWVIEPYKSDKQI